MTSMFGDAATSCHFLPLPASTGRDRRQRALFQDTLTEDEASLQAQPAELQRGLPAVPKTAKALPRKLRRERLPDTWSA